MKTYLIYHVPGKKIGCTKDLHRRMSQQGFTRWEILEEHNCIYEASDREIQLQKDYGLPVDKVPYHISVQNRSKWTDETRHQLTPEDGRKGGSISGLLKPSEEAKIKMGLAKAKLRNEADSIRERFKQWELSKHKFELLISEEYGVSRTTINRILRKLIY